MNIVVVGGGTAGWITALFAEKAIPEARITVIESDDIGILGAGEGTTPNFVTLMAHLGIDTAELIDHCKATLKTGIRFVGWHPERDYHFPFPASAGLGEQHYRFTIGNLATSMSPPMAARHEDDLRAYDLLYRMADKGLCPMYERGMAEPQDVIPGINSVTQWGVHFDARDVAAYLRAAAEGRGIVRVEGRLGEIVQDSDGFITALHVRDHVIPADFVFDATGFARVIVGGLFGSEWSSFAEQLPANRALPFFLPADENPPAYTQAIAMEYGWMWKIPLQHRYGCGYIFDSSRITDDEAKAEIERVIGGEVELLRPMSFSAGAYATPFVNNVLAVGLAAGFVEPLEATSLWQLAQSLQRFFGAKAHLTTRSKAVRDAFNRVAGREISAIVDFLYMHYVTEREGEFWEGFKDPDRMPELVSQLLEVSQARPMYNELDILCRQAFTEGDYTTIMVGTGALSQEVLASWDLPNDKENDDRYHEMLSNLDGVLGVLMTHREFLDRCAKHRVEH